MFKVISWNIQQGGGSRIPKILDFVAKHKAQVMVFSEFKNNERGVQLRSGLLKLNYHFQHVAHHASDINTVLIASQLPCNTRLFPKCDTQYSHGIIAADFSAFTIYGVYFPHKKKHKLFDFLLDKELQNRHAILCGDFNSGINHIDQSGNSFWYEDKVKALIKSDYIDGFRFLHGAMKEYSWYSHQGNGYRYDHTFIHSDLAPLIKECYYIHTAREEKYSDHAPMVLALG